MFEITYIFHGQLGKMTTPSKTEAARLYCAISLEYRPRLWIIGKAKRRFLVR